MSKTKRMLVFCILHCAFCIGFSGCSMQSLYFLMPEAKEPAGLKRLADDKKEVKALLWTTMALDSREEFIRADQELAVRLAEEIERLSKQNREKVTVVNPTLVAEYKSRYPNWRALDPDKVGRDFQADYVIDMQIKKLSLYKPHDTEPLYQGSTEISVSVVDMHNLDSAAKSKTFTDRYPGEGRIMFDNYNMEPTVFREKFLDHLARRLSFYFVEHQKRSRMVPTEMDD